MKSQDRHPEQTALVLQGGGALGAYQAGAYTALSLAGHEPDWIAGISIGAINAAIIAGNPKQQRAKKLRNFWEMLSGWLMVEPVVSRNIFTEWAASMVMLRGVPGFFSPRFPTPHFATSGSLGACSYYDTDALRTTLNALIDFDYLNTQGPRLSVGAVNVETGNFIYFDSATRELRAEHIMASGALPPGFGAVEIDGKFYWDGGLVSNTPLQFILENAGPTPLTVFQVDLFSAQGMAPRNIPEVNQREKDIRYSSRTRLTTDRFHELHKLSAAAQRLKEKLPQDMQNDPDLAALCTAGPHGNLTLMHLIHRKQSFEGPTKDYEFSRVTMKDHWDEGLGDVKRSLANPRWKNRKNNAEGITIFDFGTDKQV